MKENAYKLGSVRLSTEYVPHRRAHSLPCGRRIGAICLVLKAKDGESMR